MPMTRYQIRNEFNLADPELYRAADKDDPEALLEGVAMAGLVGLLRQLGDLAEFAAEIFHDLHEEVMATAARGHGLMDRIQQLEADVPLIEKNLLSQTNHTTFYYNTGADWHPQMCTDQNLITQGDMPRFIRDSYEECRGPPQLFLLDKFDVGGAGACLKRYTDPSSFKVEPTTSDAAKYGFQRDRRNRKIKKKGSHLKNGDTPEMLTTSHAKLHQLLLEERIGNDSRDSTRHVKLKKRILDGSKSGNSYMEKFLRTLSPKHSDEIEVAQPILSLTYHHSDASEREIFDIQPVSDTKNSHYFSHTGQEMQLRPSAKYSYDFSKSRRNRGSTVRMEDGYSIETALPPRIPDTEKELGLDGNNTNGDGDVSLFYDAKANETEKYMDALANMESETETDNEYIPKKELHYYSKHVVVDNSNEQDLDSQSVNESIVSDDGSISFTKGTSTSSSHGAPIKEHYDREAEASLSMKAYDAVAVDYSDTFDYDETDKITSKQQLNVNGETVGSVATTFNYKVGDISFQKDSLLLQSSDSGLSSTELTSAGVFYNMTSSEAIHDSEYPQLERTRVNGGAVTTPDGRFKVDNASAKRSPIERLELEVPSEVLTTSLNESSHDHSKLSGVIENDTLHKGRIDECLITNVANEEIVASQSTSYVELHDFEQGYQDDGRSRLTPFADESNNNNHFIVPKDENATTTTGEILDCSNQVMSSAEEHIEYTVAAALEVHANYDGGLSNSKRELAAPNFLCETHDTEVQISSDELFQSETGDKLDYGQALLPSNIYSLSGNEISDDAVICNSDSITQQFRDLQTEKEVNSERMPPLPPLPPMQWTVGKLQDSFFDAEGESTELLLASNESLSPSEFGLKGSLNITPLDGEIQQPLNATETVESSQNTSIHHLGGVPLATDSSLQVNDEIDEHGKNWVLKSEEPLTDSSTIHQRTHVESDQPDILAFAGETPESSSGSCLPSPYSDAFTKEAVQSSHTAQSSVPLLGDFTTDVKQSRPAEHAALSAGETIQSSVTRDSPQPPLEDTLVSKYNAADITLEESTSYSRTEHETQNQGKIIKPPEVPGPLMKDEEHHKQQQEIKSSERQASWSLALLNYEGEKLAEKPAVRPPRPRNPLIESVGALDRSKLKKVTTLSQPKAPAVDERGSLLEQIRTKSFNLKPAPAPVLKPIIQAPTMNLKVAAILEKANKIRRATAGSDEDDEDDWSDD